jgi:hypothetical protein
MIKTYIDLKNRAETTIGGLGSDIIFSNGGNDIVSGGAGSDFIYLGADNDIGLYNRHENIGSVDLYAGGSGTDTLRIQVDYRDFQAAGMTTLDAWKIQVQTYFDKQLAQSGAWNASHRIQLETIFDFNQLGSGKFNLLASGFEKLDIQYVNTAPASIDYIDAKAFSTLEDTKFTGKLELEKMDPDTGTVGMAALKSFVELSSSGAKVAWSSTGAFTVETAPNYYGKLDFLYTVADASGATSTGKATLNVQSISDAPIAADNGIEITQGRNYQFKVADFADRFADPGDAAAPNNFAGIKISSVSPSLKYDGRPIGVIEEKLIAANDIGRLSYDAVVGGMDDQFTFRVIDDGGSDRGGQNQSSAYEMAIDFHPVARDDRHMIVDDIEYRVLARASFPGYEERPYVALLDSNGTVGANPGDMIYFASGLGDLGTPDKTAGYLKFFGTPLKGSLTSISSARDDRLFMRAGLGDGDMDISVENSQLLSIMFDSPSARMYYSLYEKDSGPELSILASVSGNPSTTLFSEVYGSLDKETASNVVQDVLHYEFFG